MVFNQPQRLVVPLFQRPYVWNEDDQWEPLWNDVVRLADRLAERGKPQPHFLGAVVLQQLPNPVGMMQQRTIIDGQQRLTTLQLLLDALRTELHEIESARSAALRIEALVVNSEHYREKPEDQFKVWPTNRDRPSFNAVMRGGGPVEGSNDRIPEAHRFFREKAREWMRQAGDQSLTARAAALESAVRDHLQIVVIDLAAEENAQEIFETLNARGAPLTAADLIKNFVFQRLQESSTDVERAYDRHWKEFETAFWEAEVPLGRLRYPRSSLFMNHWLVARTGTEIVGREVFARFKAFADYDSDVRMPELLEQVHRAAGVYRAFIEGAQQVGSVTRLGLFGYRTGVMESEVIKPFILLLQDPESEPIPDDQFTKALDVMESWMVRRMLVRATTKSYSRFMADLVQHLRRTDRSKAGDVLDAFLAGQRSAASYWPDDDEVRDELEALLAYRRLGRGRLRMVLEAIEDHYRGWRDGKAGLGGERVARAQYAIEHVMPRKWQSHWPLQGDAAERDRLIHTFGNLTLLMTKLNSKVSNGPWAGPEGKRAGLETHDVLVLNRELLKGAADPWSDELIRRRTAGLTDAILRIWPVPPGHHSEFSVDRKPRARKKVRLSDLVSAGLLNGVTTLYPRPRKHRHRYAALLSDGTIEVDDQLFENPSGAASYIAGGLARNGWSFFAIDPAFERSLKSLRRDYINDLAVEVEDDEDDEDEDES